MTVRRAWSRVRRFRFTAGVLVGALLAGAAWLGADALRPDPAAWEKGRLVIMSGRDDSAGGQRQVLVEQWNRMYPDHPAEIRQVSGLADAQHSEMVSQARSGRSDVDIYNLDVTWTPEFAHAGYLDPLDERGLDTTGFLTGPLETCRYEGRLWALPFNTDAGLLFRRSDLVPEAPGDWTRARADMSRVLSDPARPRELVAGYTGQYGDYEGLTVNTFEAVWAAGGHILVDGRVALDDRAREAVRALAEDARSSNPSRMLPDSLRFDETQSTTAFRDGKVVLLRNWPVAYRRLADGPDTGGRPLPFAVSKLPGPSVLGGQNLAVASSSTRPAAARALIAYLTSARTQQLLFERGGFAATQRIVYEDPQVMAHYSYARTLLSAIEGARLRPVTPHYWRFSEVFRAGVREALNNGGTLPADFADRLTRALRGQ
ncbi:extracellular solute-binding protein [Longispora urticae]